jgi:hypothetical protein
MLDRIEWVQRLPTNLLVVFAIATVSFRLLNRFPRAPFSLLGRTGCPLRVAADIVTMPLRCVADVVAGLRQ